jgi:hypothetical protein
MPLFIRELEYLHSDGNEGLLLRNLRLIQAEINWGEWVNANKQEYLTNKAPFLGYSPY